MTKTGILLPGYACTSEIWQLICADLGAIYNLICVDWPVEATPGFTSLGDFAVWLNDPLWPRPCDFIVGHSLGGLVAIQLAASSKVVIPEIILVETFLLPPAPFFQSILLDEASSDPKHVLQEMLEREKAFYSARLRETLREIDNNEQVSRLGKTIHALYGDRGSGNSKEVINKLHWSEKLSASVDVSVIQGACHFPMIENPQAIVQVLKSVISS